MTKTGPQNLNEATRALVSLVTPGSPPIPTPTTGSSTPRRRGKLSLDVDDEDEQTKDSLQQLRIAYRQRHGMRPRASTLPSLNITDGAGRTEAGPTAARQKGRSTENLQTFNMYGDAVGAGAEFYDSDSGEDDTLTTVYENEGNVSLAYDDSEDEFLDDDDDEDGRLDESDDDDDNDMLSGLSEEDDSDIEEDLKYAVQQIKMQQGDHAGGAPGPGDSPVRGNSVSSTGTLPPLGRSPRSRRPTGASTSSMTSLTTPSAASHRRVPKKQRSLDVGFNGLANGGVQNAPGAPSNAAGGTPGAPAGRRMSVPSRSRAMSVRTADGPNLSPGLSRDNKPARTDVSVPSSMKGETFPSAEQIATQQKLDAGLDLDVASRLPYRSSATDLGTAIPAASLSSSRLASRPIAPVSTTSRLTAQIKAKQASFDNPLEQYVAASGRSERKPLRLKMYMPSSSQPKVPWEVVVRTDANVAMAIGFALYRYQELKRDKSLPLELCDANRWNLMIVEDDGEPDEDFPALDRTRLISAYSFDEFALVEATPDQVRKNEQETPNTRKPRAVQAAPAVTDNASGTGAASGDQSAESSAPDTANASSQEETATVRVYQYPFDEILSKVYWEATLPLGTRIGSILESVCREKLMDASMYALKIAGRKIVAANDRALDSLEGRYNLELTPKRVITLANGYELQHTSSTANDGLRRTATTTRKVYSALATRGAEDAKVYRQSVVMAGATLPEMLTTAGYHRYQVWRRQPMSFIGRHERVLSIDGEYVHITPPENRTLFDSPKTSSFHMSQVIKCKQSAKVPQNFKVVVMKTSGPKRYDLEAVSAAQSAEIVTKIRSLASKYQK